MKSFFIFFILTISLVFSANSAEKVYRTKAYRIAIINYGLANVRGTTVFYRDIFGLRVLNTYDLNTAEGLALSEHLLGDPKKYDLIILKPNVIITRKGTVVIIRLKNYWRADFQPKTQIVKRGARKFSLLKNQKHEKNY